MAYDAAVKPPTQGLQERGQKAKKMGDQAFSAQAVFLPLWQAQAEIFYPERADFTMTYSAADERYEGIYTAEPQLLRRDMANNLGAMIRPRGRDWFRAAARPGRIMDDDDAKRWCEQASKTMRNIIYSPQARFTKALGASDHDYVTFGHAVIAHPYNANQTGILFQCLHPRDCAYVRNSEGVVDTMYQKMKLSLRTMVSMFGADRLPKEWRDRLTDHPEEKHTIMRCVHPIAEDEYGPDERRIKAAKFTSLYVACSTREEATLGEGFFLSFPFTVREWLRTAPKY